MIKKFINKNTFIWPLLGSLILWVLIGIVSDKFTLNQLLSSSKLATFALILAFAQMIVVTSGDGAIDLSQQYILTLCAYMACDLMKVNIFVGLAAAILVGTLCGLVNGLINVYLKVPAMITTLASGYIIFTIILIGAPHMTTLPSPSLVKFININFFGVSMLTVICVIVAVLLSILLYKTKYGRNLHAVGQNKAAAKYSGIPVKRVVITAFAIGGALCGLTGILCGAFIGGAFQDMGSTYFLPSVAAAFVGGTVASGGKSNVVGVFFGALMMSFMSMFLNAADLSPGMQKLIQGAFLVLILVASVSKEAKKR